MPPPIYQLNHPPHPFWDFVQEMNEHPFWRGAPRSGPPQPPSSQPEASQAAPADANTQREQTPADDPPEVDPSTLGGEHCRHQRRCARRCGRDQQRGPFQQGGPQAGGWPAFGPPPFTMGGGPFAGPHGHHGPHPHHPFGFRGRGGHHHRGGPGFHRGGPRGHHHHGPQPTPPHAGFNLGKFLNDLGDRIGVDLTGAAEGLGIDRFMPSSSSPDVDFEPKVDIFDLADQFVIHTSLPGARKEDVGVDWDGEHSILRLAGVVHRPEVDEVMLQHLSVDGRKREVGVFEKAIRLGTVKEPASIDVAGIKAKMADGVLVVRVPKVEKEHHKRDVPISSATPSPPRYHPHFDHEDHEMYDAAPEGVQRDYPTLQPEKPASRASRTVSAEPVSPIQAGKVNIESEKQAQSFVSAIQHPQNPQEETPQHEKHSETAHQAQPTHQFVSHEQESDSDDFASDEEGEYVKINVD